MMHGRHLEQCWAHDKLTVSASVLLQATEISLVFLKSWHLFQLLLICHVAYVALNYFCSLYKCLFSYIHSEKLCVGVYIKWIPWEERYNIYSFYLFVSLISSPIIHISIFADYYDDTFISSIFRLWKLRKYPSCNRKYKMNSISRKFF